ncbi:MAG TPA: hypothetical protein VET88_13085 [Gammaproteobacteria bacterium]|nr:hypothetical protein [Gammaproteobacteria bacterium]
MDPRELTDLVLNSYDTDIKGLSYITRDKAFPELLDAMLDYDAYLAENYLAQADHEALKKASSGTNILHMATVTPDLHRILLLSHLACCCELLNGWTISSQDIGAPELPDVIRRNILQQLERSPDQVIDLTKRINTADTVRTIQILKLLGLLKFNSNNTRQLSLGAGFGRKDMYAVHATPGIALSTDTDPYSGKPGMVFTNSALRPCQITLIDNDESLSELYGKYNRESNGSIRAIVDDATAALDSLPMLIQKGAVAPVNLIMGIRVDHRMIDDVGGFFARLCKVMEAEADMVISVGAGFSVSEFEGRITLVSNIFDYLNAAGLEPTRVILHSGKNLKESRERPAFGYPAVATHEILYCRLQRDRLPDAADRIRGTTR